MLSVLLEQAAASNATCSVNDFEALLQLHPKGPKQKILGDGQCIISSGGQEVWCAANIPPPPAGSQLYGLDEIYDVAVADPLSLPEFLYFCPQSLWAIAQDCTSAYWYLQDQGYSMSLWRDLIFESGSDDWGISETEVCDHESNMKDALLGYYPVPGENQIASMTSWTYSQNQLITCDEGCQKAVPDTFNNLVGNFTSAIKPLLLMQVRSTGMQNYQTRLALDVSLESAYHEVLGEAELPPLAPDPPKPPGESYGSQFFGVLGDATWSFSHSASSSWKYFPGLSGKQADAIAGIIRLTEKVFIPISQIAVEDPSDPSNWQVREVNPLLKTAADLTWSYDSMRGAYKSQNENAIQYMRNFSWLIAQSPNARELMPFNKEIADGILGNSAAGDICGSVWEQSPLYQVWDTTIRYNTFKQLMPTRYRVCAEYLPVCQNPPMQAPNDGVGWDAFECRNNANVCFGEVIDNMLWKGNTEDYQHTNDYWSSNCMVRLTDYDWPGNDSPDVTNADAGGYSSCNYCAYRSCQLMEDFTDWYSFNNISHTADEYHGWLCGYESATDPNNNIIPTKALTDKINSLLQIFGNPDPESNASEADLPNLTSLTKPYVAENPMYNLFRSNNSLGWYFNIYRFPDMSTLSGEESRKLAASAMSIERDYEDPKQADDVHPDFMCCGGMPSCSQNRWADTDAHFPLGESLTIKAEHYGISRFAACHDDQDVVSCSISVGMSTSRRRKYLNWGVYPSYTEQDWSYGKPYNQTCQCPGAGTYSDKYPSCHAVCISSGYLSSFDPPTSMIHQSETFSGSHTVTCPEGYVVSGCGIDNGDHEAFPDVFASADDACQCYNAAGTVSTCWSSCFPRTGLREYQRLEQDFSDHVEIQCPGNMTVLGCGFQVKQKSGDWEKSPEWYADLDDRKCHCYNYYSATCHAICGSFSTWPLGP